MKLFTILGYSAHGETLCPSCLRTSTGLSPSCPDYDGRSILPLYAGDPTVLEESCTYCGRSLLELRALADAERSRRSPLVKAQKTLHRDRQPALRFDRRPPGAILSELKKAGWRWDPVARLWWWPAAAPVPVPAALALPHPARGGVARPPLRRRSADISRPSAGVGTGQSPR